LNQIMTAVKVWIWWSFKQVIDWKSKHLQWTEGKTTMAMRWTMHFSYDVYSTVYCTVRGKKARLAITGDLVIKTRDIVISVQNNVWYCNTEMSTPRYLVDMRVAYSQKLYYTGKRQKNAWYCDFPIK
jgi:hypothetical protein